MKRFGQIEFDEVRGRLRVAGRAVELDRFSLAILSVLFEHAGEQVSKDQLLEAGWPGRLVQENSLAKAISRLRQALGEDGEALETVHGYGYRLAIDLAGKTDPTIAAAAPKTAPRPATWRRPAVLAAVAVLAILATGGAVMLPDRLPADEQRQVINGEAADAIGRVLWVDDHPENNATERHYLERRKIAVYQVGNSRDALTLLKMYEYGAVISDMGRNGKPLAGLQMLREMRARSDQRPFFLYTVHASPELRRLIADAGGQAVVESREALYADLLPLFDHAPPEAGQTRR